MSGFAAIIAVYLTFLALCWFGPMLSRHSGNSGVVAATVLLGLFPTWVLVLIFPAFREIENCVQQGTQDCDAPGLLFFGPVVAAAMPALLILCLSTVIALRKIRNRTIE